MGETREGFGGGGGPGVGKVQSAYQQMLRLDWAGGMECSSVCGVGWVGAIQPGAKGNSAATRILGKGI